MSRDHRVTEPRPPVGVDDDGIDRTLDAGRTAYLGLRYRGPAPQWQAERAGARRWVPLAAALAAVAVLVSSVLIWRSLDASSSTPSGGDAIRLAAAPVDLERPIGEGDGSWMVPGPPEPPARSPSDDGPPPAPETQRPAASDEVRSPAIERLDGVGLGTLEILRREVDRLEPGVRSKPPRFTGLTLRLPIAPSRWSPGPPPTRGIAGD